MRRCAYCDTEVNDAARYCPRCLALLVHHPVRRGRQWVMLGVAVFGGIAAFSFAVLGVEHRVVRSSGRPLVLGAVPVASAPAGDEASLLLESCGPPDRDLSSAQTDPPAPLPFRIVEYQSAHLQFAFVPARGTPVGAPPPYHWVLSGILDTSTGARLSEEEARRRLPCWRPSAPPAAPQTATSMNAPGADATPVGTTR